MAFNFFENRGYAVNVLYSSFSHSLKKYRKLSNNKFISLETISYKSSFSLKRIISYLIFAYKVFKFLGSNKFDLVYINLPPNAIGLSVLFRKNSYTKLIVDIIDLWPEAFPTNNSLIKNTLLYFAGILPKMIRKRIINYSDFCIAESNFFQKQLNLDNKINSKVIHIKKFQKFKPNHNSLSSDMSIVYLGNIGNIYDFNSLFSILEGVLKKRKVTLHIIGLGPLKNWVIENLNAKKINYFYHGATFDEKLKEKIISNCWFGYNGYKESTEVALSYKSVDYLSFGVPLINSAKEDTEYLVNNENIGFNFNAKSLDSLIHKLSNICIEDVCNMKRRSYEIFKDKFSGKSYLFEMDSILASLKKSIDK